MRDRELPALFLLDEACGIHDIFSRRVTEHISMSICGCVLDRSSAAANTATASPSLFLLVKLVHALFDFVPTSDCVRSAHPCLVK